MGPHRSTLSPDAKSLSILFDEYYVEAGGATNKSFDRKSLQHRHPGACAAGPERLDPRRSTIAATTTSRTGAKTTFAVEYFFAGRQGPTLQQDLQRPELDKDYLITNKLQASALVWSACGADVNLRTNSSIRVQTKQNKEALATRRLRRT